MLIKHFLLLGLLILIPLGYIVFQILPTSFSNEQIHFVIPLETKQVEIIRRLKSENFIRNEKIFSFILSIIRFPGAIEPGAYQLSRNMNTFQIADILLNHPYQKWIVLVPGLRIEQVAERLAKKFNWDSAKTKEFLSAGKEGYMYPDTYLLNTDYSPSDVARRLIANFNEKFDSKIRQDLLNQDVRNDTAVKIASLIERESGGDEDKALIAGIIWNRLDKGMRLQIDATIQYVLGTPNDWWPMVKPPNMKTESPYNTYLYKGLTPGPICNPSLASIKAATYPSETNCIFYLHDRAKQIHCAVTYEEHLNNIEKYLK